MLRFGRCAMTLQEPMFRLVLFASLLVVVGCCGVAEAVGLPANTRIELTADAGFNNAFNERVASEPITRTLTVVQVAAVHIDATRYTGELGAGQTVYIPVRFVNDGNGTDQFDLEINASAGWQAALVYDEDGDGVYDPGSDTEQNSTFNVVHDGYVPFFARVTAPAQLTSAGTVTISAYSVVDTGVSCSQSLAINVRQGPVIQVTFPTSDVEFARNSSTLRLAGKAYDKTNVKSVEWLNTTTGASGVCSLSTPSWTADNIELALGENTIKLTATDVYGETSELALSVSYLQASPGDSWTGLSMVSVPLIPDQTDPKPVVEFYQDYWLCYAPSTNSYLRYPNQQTYLARSTSTPARGFWTRFPAQHSEPVGTIPPQDKPVTVALRRGWNLVGQPFVRPVRWNADSVTVRRLGETKTLREATSLLSMYAWGWRQNPVNPDTGEYYMVCDPSFVPDAAPNLEPWQAYWIYAYIDCELILPPPGQ